MLRGAGTSVEILAFRHPEAGLQLVKGSIERGERPEEASLRELAEESGITEARVVRSLGAWRSGHEAQIWWFALVRPAQPLPDAWEHYAPDAGGVVFTFFWHPLAVPVGVRWHPVFQRAIAFIRTSV